MPDSLNMCWKFLQSSIVSSFSGGAAREIRVGRKEVVNVLVRKKRSRNVENGGRCILGEGIAGKE
jgi:hypothetical protein